MMFRFITFVCLLIICSIPLFAQTISVNAGTVKDVKGEVFYHCHKNAKEAQELKKDAKLHDEDIVITSESGSAVLTLNPDSYLLIENNTNLRVKETNLDSMHFDIERGEVFVFARSLKNGISLVIHTPPGIITVHKKGGYRFFVEDNGNTEVNVSKGELRYFDKQGKLVSLKKGKRVNFIKPLPKSDSEKKDAKIQ